MRMCMMRLGCKKAKIAVHSRNKIRLRPAGERGEVV